MLNRVVLVFLKVVVGFFAFYLVLAAVVLPLTLKWAVESQGSRLLRHPVRLAAAGFNPFLWKLEVRGFSVLDAGGKMMAGFARLALDVSFTALFSKTYRVESLAVDGLTVNAALLDGGRLDLADLVPAVVPAAVTDGTRPGKAAAPSPGPLPLVVVDLVTLRDGRVNFLDRTVHPNFSVAVHAIDVRVTGFSTRPDGITRVVLKAGLGEKGTLDTELNIKPLVVPLEAETSFTLNDFALDALSPYVGKYTGRALKDGGMEFRMDYRIAGNKLSATHKVLIQRFTFGDKVESKDALPLPFGLAVALLEDPQGRIKISLPVTGDMSKPDFHYWSLVGQVVTNFFTGLVTKPFAFLASALGADSGTDELGYVRFLPGRGEIPEPEQKKILTLLQGLKEHPKLKLEVDGGYDPDLDWKAVKADTLAKDYAELRKASSRSDSAVYQMLYQRRVGIRELWELTKKFKGQEVGYDDAGLVGEIKRLLVEGGVPDKPALEALAAARAKAVYDFVVASGFDPARVSTGPVRQEQASMGFVPSEFTLTVFGAE